MIRNKINVLKSRFRKYKINGYIIPKNDDYFTEYAENDRLKKITGFSGSAGIAVILKKNNYLFVDGRYTIQAHQESSKNFKIIEIHKKLPNKIIKNCNLYIGNDTGFMHMSAALGIKSIGIFTDSPAYSYSGYSKNIIPIVPKGETVESTTHDTLGKDNISLEEVLSSAKKFLI